MSLFSYLLKIIKRKNANEEKLVNNNYKKLDSNDIIVEDKNNSDVMESQKNLTSLTELNQITNSIDGSTQTTSFNEVDIDYENETTIVTYNETEDWMLELKSQGQLENNVVVKQKEDTLSNYTWQDIVDNHNKRMAELREIRTKKEQVIAKEKIIQKNNNQIEKSVKDEEIERERKREEKLEWIKKEVAEYKLQEELRKQKESIYLKRQEELTELKKQEDEVKKQGELAELKKQEERNVQEKLAKLKKQEEEKKKQEELAEVKKQEERKVQEELVKIKKQEEERKRQEELLVEFKLQEEKRQQAIEEKNKKNEEIKRLEDKKKADEEYLKNQKIKEYEIMVGGFNENITEVYHITYGKGNFVRFESLKRYIIVRFENDNKEYTFQFPDSINSVLFLVKPKKIIERELYLENSKHKKVDIDEKTYFDKVCTVIESNISNYKYEEGLPSLNKNDFTDDYEADIRNKKKLASNSVALWTSIRLNPYFARVNYGEENSIYIGKNAIEGYVIDWRDKICNLYYQYNIYIGNEKYKLSLVRDFEITAGRYLGYIDKYYKENFLNDIELNNDIISDPLLLKIIKFSRANNKAHDIIQTIQVNQYEIITQNLNENLIVLGCAGSGKTMIMLHRLSYLIYNNTNINLNNVFVLSPTALLNLENNDLSKTLKINNANRMDTLLFYKYILRIYYKNNKVFDNRFQGKIKSNETLEDSFINKIYGDGFIKNYINKINKTITNGTDENREFIRRQERLLLGEYKKFIFAHDYENTFEIFHKDNELNNIFVEFKTIVSNIPIENAYEKSKRLKDNKNPNAVRQKKVLDGLIQNWNMSNRTIYDNKNKEILIHDGIFSKLFRYLKLLEKNNKNIKTRIENLNQSYDDIYDLISDYKIFTDKVERFSNFKNGYVKEFYIEVIYELIKNMKINSNLNIEDSYEFELFLILIACNSYFGSINNDLIIFIDEFQDYSLNELLLYKSIFPNAILNIFGDINQCINAKGINNYSFKNTLKEWKLFNINENYRNALEITKYVNASFNLNMIPIGISGCVKKISIKDFSNIININIANRECLIVKNLDYFNYLKNNYLIYLGSNEDRVNIIQNDDSIISHGKLNVIPISLVKGLEFEKVYVITDGMNKNERYVSFTRALNELYIVQDNPNAYNQYIELHDKENTKIDDL